MPANQSILDDKAALVRLPMKPIQQTARRLASKTEDDYKPKHQILRLSQITL